MLTDTEIVTTRLLDRHGVQWEARDLSGRTDRPLLLGGKNGGPMASEHVLIALASCTSTTAIKIAEKRSVKLHDIRCEAAMDFDDRGEVAVIRLQVDVVSPDPAEKVTKVFDLAERSCTISRILSVAIERTIRVRAT